MLLSVEERYRRRIPSAGKRSLHQHGGLDLVNDLRYAVPVNDDRRIAIPTTKGDPRCPPVDEGETGEREGLEPVPPGICRITLRQNSRGLQHGKKAGTSRDYLPACQETIRIPANMCWFLHLFFTFLLNMRGES